MSTVTYLAILANDSIALPLQPAFPLPELKYILDQSQTPLLLVTSPYAKTAQSLLELGSEGDPVLQVNELTQTPAEALPHDAIQLEDIGDSQGGMMLYTSGTTNKPVSFILLLKLQIERC